MILTFTPNPALDLTLELDVLDHGGTNRIPSARARSGGKGLNVARVLTEQGFPVRALAAVGEADIADFRQDLDGIDHDILPIPGRLRRSYAIVETAPNLTTILNETGQAQDATVRGAIADKVRAHLLGTARVLCISGSVPPNSPDTLIADRVSDAHAAGVSAVVDATGAQLLEACRAGADLVKPNRAELIETVGESDPLTGAHALQRLGARTVVVSLGEEGMMLVSPDGSALQARLPRVLSGNPTGAGDAAVAAIASLWTGTEAPDPAALLRRATAWSAAAVLMPLAGSISPEHRALATEVQITEYSPISPSAR